MGQILIDCACPCPFCYNISFASYSKKARRTPPLQLFQPQRRAERSGRCAAYCRPHRRVRRDSGDSGRVVLEEEAGDGRGAKEGGGKGGSGGGGCMRG